jgi:hypothetical protein
LSDQHVVVTLRSGNRMAIQKYRLGNFWEQVSEPLTEDEVESEQIVVVEYRDDYNHTNQLKTTSSFDEILNQSGFGGLSGSVGVQNLNG